MKHPTTVPELTKPHGTALRLTLAGKAQVVTLPGQTSKSILAYISTDELIRLYEHFPVSKIVDRLAPGMDPVEKNRLKKAIWARLKKTGYKARPSGEAIRLAKIGRPRLKLPLHTHPGEGPADKWKIVELKIAGKSNREIAKLLNRAQPSIYMALRRMGFPDGTGVTACYSFGERFDRAALRHLYKISGLNVTELAREIKIGFSTLEPHLATRGGRQVHFNTARRASEWRKNLFVRLMAGATRNPGRQNSNYSQSRVIVTFFPNLRERYSFLLEVLHRLAKKLRDNPEWSQDQLQQYLCEQAMGEKAGRSPGDLFNRFLPWAPELVPFLAGRLQEIQGVHHQRIAWELLAGSLGTTAPIISAVINPAQAQKIRPIPPEQMRWLILNWAKSKPGPQPNDTLNAEIERLYEAKKGDRAEIDRGDWSEIKSELDHRTGVHLSIDAYQMRLKRYRSRRATG